jgi:quercetin dioxygenase-like cupin family protein
MEKISIKDNIVFTENKFNMRNLITEADYRMFVLNLKAGQKVPEHAAPGTVTIYVVEGQVMVAVGEERGELAAKEAVRCAPGALHSVEALEDSALLVLITGRAK